MSDARPVRFLPGFADPADVYSRTAAWLARAVADPGHPFRWPAVATVGPDGFPVVRTVVLRAFDGAARVATFHTDVRARKVAHLRADPRLALHFYDPNTRFQVRLPATATLHHADDVARAEWDRLPDTGRATYDEPEAPGAPLPPDAPVRPPAPAAATDAAVFARFVAVRCRFDELELLELHPAGNRRAVLAWAAGGVTLTRIGA